MSGNGDKPSPDPADAPSNGAVRKLAEDPHNALDAYQRALEADQNALEADQTLSDTDQTASDGDHTSADGDWVAAERDQDLANADQRASDHDQVAADRELAAAPPGATTLQHSHDVSTSERHASTAARTASTVVRTRNATERLDAADRRDVVSGERDRVADARDRAADARDRMAARFQPVGPAVDVAARAAADRKQAADDRRRAAADREQAAADRRQVRTALAEAHLDELTGTYRRGLGILEIQREINRARHSGGPLVLAFVDIDGLKQVNDLRGHAAGDALLVEVATTIRSKLRSYDPIVRYGGDEFICAFSNFGLDEVRQRFEKIQAALREKDEGCSISVGLAQLKDDDTLDELTARGDAALYEARRRKRGAEA